MKIFDYLGWIFCEASIALHKLLDNPNVTEHNVVRWLAHVFYRIGNYFYGLTEALGWDR